MYSYKLVSSTSLEESAVRYNEGTGVQREWLGRSELKSNL